VNISGVAVEQLQRGDVLARPGSYRPSRRLDVRFRLLPDVSQAVKHNLEVKLFIGAAEVLARLRLLGAEELRPGEEGWLQLELAQEVLAVRGDRYILRRPSPGETLGGGVVVDTQPKGRHKRFSPEVLARLNALAQGTPAEVLLQAMLALGAAPWREVAARSGLDRDAAAQAGEELLGSGQMLLLEDGPASAAIQSSPPPDLLVTTRGFWDQLSSKVLADLENYHRAYPLKRGMPKEELKSRLKISPRLFNAALRKLADGERVEEAGPFLLLPGHEIRFTPAQQRLVDGLLARFAASPYTPPSVKEAQAEAGEEVYNALLELGMLVQVAPEVVFRREDYDRMVAEVRRLLQERGTLTAAEVRDHFNTSRKYALALLEHLDTIGMTVREGDLRRLKR
jgi:selenocysteine-specific elongation factor